MATTSSSGDWNQVSEPPTPKRAAESEEKQNGRKSPRTESESPGHGTAQASGSELATLGSGNAQDVAVWPGRVEGAGMGPGTHVAGLPCAPVNPVVNEERMRGVLTNLLSAGCAHCRLNSRQACDFAVTECVPMLAVNKVTNERVEVTTWCVKHIAVWLKVAKLQELEKEVTGEFLGETLPTDWNVQRGSTTHPGDALM